MIGLNRFCRFGGWSDPESLGGGQANQAPEVACPSRWLARPLGAEDADAWEELFTGYCDFYERRLTAGGRRVVWSWIEGGAINCLLVVPADRPEGRAVGLAHVRPMPSPLRGATVGFLDDLFVAPAARGTGAFECLIAAVRDLATARGWSQVRWITAADNARARAAYDRVATKTDWVTYQLDI